MYVCSYVCTYGAILKIRLAEEYQLVRNKQAGKQQRIYRLVCLLRLLRPVKYRSR